MHRLIGLGVAVQKLVPGFISPTSDKRRHQILPRFDEWIGLWKVGAKLVSWWMII